MDFNESHIKNIEIEAAKEEADIIYGRDEIEEDIEKLKDKLSRLEENSHHALD